MDGEKRVGGQLDEWNKRRTGNEMELVSCWKGSGHINH